jgi:hypothetical protein
MREVMPAHERFSCIQSRDCTGQIALGKLQAGKKHPIRSEGVDTLYLLRQLEALLSILLCGMEVIPLVEDTGEAKVRFTGKPLRRITDQLQDASVALGRQSELVV